jgi:serine/threonine protein phosphatase PrpC
MKSHPASKTVRVLVSKSGATTTFVQDQDFAARQYRGRRDNQEDYYAFADATETGGRSLERLMLVVGDGLGAHAGGSVASYLGVNAFVRAFHEVKGSPPHKLHHALQTANSMLGYITARMPAVAPPMGTTMIGALVTPKWMEWISVGDSPLFLFRDGTLSRINQDHSLAPLIDERAKRGEISAEEAANHPDRHTLQSALLGIPMTMIDSPPHPITLKKGDIIIGASDGIFTLSHKALEELLQFGKHTTADKIADAIIFAIRRINDQRQDNTTVGVVKMP